MVRAKSIAICRRNRFIIFNGKPLGLRSRRLSDNGVLFFDGKPKRQSLILSVSVVLVFDRIIKLVII